MARSQVFSTYISKTLTISSLCLTNVFFSSSVISITQRVMTSSRLKHNLFILDSLSGCLAPILFVCLYMLILSLESLASLYDHLGQVNIICCLYSISHWILLLPFFPLNNIFSLAMVILILKCIISQGAPYSKQPNVFPLS